MEKRRRAERLISALRWLVVALGLIAASDNLSLSAIAAISGLAIAYNGLMTFCVLDSNRFMQWGRRMSLISRAMDIAIITYIVAYSQNTNSLTYLLYWFPLVASGYTSVQSSKLFVASLTAITANAVATFYAMQMSGSISHVANTIGLRTTVMVFGILVSAYISKTRSQDELAADRGSYLQAILNCGARLTSFRNVHELAKHVLESAVTQTGAAGGELRLVSEESNELECEAFYSIYGGKTEDQTPSASLLESYSNWVMSSKRELLVRTGGRCADDKNIERNDRPTIAVPLLWQSSSNDGDPSVLGILIVWGFPGENFGDDAMDILRIFAAIAGAAIVNLRLYTGLQKSFLRTLQSLANGLDARDQYTRGHSERVMQVACMIAEELGVPPESIESLKNASLLHDIGKIGVPDAILKKAGKLTIEEWETMRKHPIVSEEICRPLGLPQEVLFLIKHHHERLDAKGYPSGLPASEQPLLQRILVVADSFDAMRSRRPYRDRMPQEELISELNRSAGRTMDPTVIDALKRLMARNELDPVYEELDRMIDGSVSSSKSAKKAA